MHQIAGKLGMCGDSNEGRPTIAKEVLNHTPESQVKLDRQTFVECLKSAAHGSLPEQEREALDSVVTRNCSYQNMHVSDSIVKNESARECRAWWTKRS